jgi:hypothetical protein
MSNIDSCGHAKYQEKEEDVSPYFCCTIAHDEILARNEYE